MDPRAKKMEMRSINLSFCNYVSMNEHMTYTPHPEDPAKTVLKQETLVTVKGVPLTSYMESAIVSTVSNNAGKGRTAIEWVVEKLAQEKDTLSSSLDKLKLEISDLTTKVEEKVIRTAKLSIDELQRDLLKLQPKRLMAEEKKSPSRGTSL